MVETAQAGPYNQQLIGKEEKDQTLAPFSTFHQLTRKNDNGNVYASTSFTTVAPTSFTDSLDQNFTRRVVGQVFSRETVTTIYGDPPENFWTQRQTGYCCYVCRSTLTNSDDPGKNTLIHCSSNNCNVSAHQACMVRYGLVNNGNPAWYCHRCNSIDEMRRLPPIEHVLEGQYFSLPKPTTAIERRVNPLHLLLAASDQIESSESLSPNGPNRFQHETKSIWQLETTTSPKLPEIEMTFHASSDPKPEPVMAKEQEEKVDVVKKFKLEYLTYDEERKNTIRNQKRTRTRQTEVFNALNDSFSKLVLERSKNAERYEALHEDNKRLNIAFQKLKISLISLAKEKPVLRVLRRLCRNEDLHEQDINEDNVVNLFMKLRPLKPNQTDKIDNLGVDSPNCSQEASTKMDMKLSPPSPYLTSNSLSNTSLCHKCQFQMDNSINCPNCHLFYHPSCFGDSKFTETFDVCSSCAHSVNKRKHYDQDFPPSKVSPALRSGKRRMKYLAPLDTKSDKRFIQPDHEESHSGNSKLTRRHNANEFNLLTPPNDDGDSIGSTNTNLDTRHFEKISLVGPFDRTPPPDLGPDATRQPARFEGDMYTPRWVRGVGKSKEGLCPHCNPPRWLKTKISAYWYHLNYQHGISSITGRPFANPVSHRENKKTGMKEALCHSCNKWILNQSPRDKDVLVPEIYWYKHAQKCHHSG